MASHGKKRNLSAWQTDVQRIGHPRLGICIILSAAVQRYEDGAGNSVEENSSVFSLIRMR